MAGIIALPHAAVIGLAADPNASARLALSGVGKNGAPVSLFTLASSASDWTAVPGTDGKNGVALTSFSVSHLDSAKLAGLDKTIRLSEDGGLR